MLVLHIQITISAGRGLYGCAGRRDGIRYYYQVVKTTAAYGTISPLVHYTVVHVKRSHQHIVNRRTGALQEHNMSGLGDVQITHKEPVGRIMTPP